MPNIFSQHEATTGPDGRFVFERVIPGRGRIGRSITFMVDEGATEVTSSYKTWANFPAGETVHLDLGGIGRPVVGRLQPPDGFSERVRWNFADITVAAGADGPYFTATVDRDGRFRVDDVPAGRYRMDVRFQREGPGHLSDHRFDVPPAGGDAAARPVDLGVLRLEGAPRRP